jgi:hypothetical protein
MPSIQSVCPGRDARVESGVVDVERTLMPQDLMLQVIAAASGQSDLTQLFGCDLVASACARALQHMDPTNVRQDFGGGMPPLDS